MAKERSSFEPDVEIRIPVLRPELPTSREVLPYLEKLDDTAVYTNFGPMALQVETRMSRLFGLSFGEVTATASGHVAIVGAILAAAGRATAERPLALCASYTFVASATAAQVCGYEPHFVDVDSKTWAMDPKALMSHPLLDQVGAVIVTAPYGRLFDLAAWEAFQEVTSVQVIIDAAASFDVLSRNADMISKTIPIALSLHATKAFGCGEGGAILCKDIDTQLRSHRAINNGFWGTREVFGDSVNGKMSEYHACVALAELDRWDAKRARLGQIAQFYQTSGKAQGLATQISVGADTSLAYALCEFDRAGHAQLACQALAKAGIGHRYWYGKGLHEEAGYGPFGSDDLSVTDCLAPRLLGLPMHLSLTQADIREICGIVAKASERGAV